MKARTGKLTRWLSQTHIPLMVYGAVAAAMICIWFLRRFHEDFAADLLAELIGVAFTIFIIDTLLVRSKTRRWRIVQENVDYLIARTVNRLRDGVALRAFHFEPDLRGADRADNAVREQRARLLRELSALPAAAIEEKLHGQELFTNDSYAYFNEKADDLWGILNMKYAEYLEPELVALLIDLHTRLKDLCGHLRHHRKSERFPGDAAAHYRESGQRGTGRELCQILRILEALKAMGYSRPPEAEMPSEHLGNGA